MPSRLPSAKHYTIVGDGALDVPQTNNYKTLMAKEETNAAKRDVEYATGEQVSFSPTLCVFSPTVVKYRQIYSREKF